MNRERVPVAGAGGQIGPQIEQQPAPRSRWAPWPAAAVSQLLQGLPPPRPRVVAHLLAAAAAAAATVVARVVWQRQRLLGTASLHGRLVYKQHVCGRSVDTLLLGSLRRGNSCLLLARRLLWWRSLLGSGCALALFLLQLRECCRAAATPDSIFCSRAWQPQNAKGCREVC